MEEAHVGSISTKSLVNRKKKAILSSLNFSCIHDDIIFTTPTDMELKNINSPIRETIQCHLECSEVYETVNLYTEDASNETLGSTGSLNIQLNPSHAEDIDAVEFIRSPTELVHLENPQMNDMRYDDLCDDENPDYVLFTKAIHHNVIHITNRAFSAFKMYVQTRGEKAMLRLTADLFLRNWTLCKFVNEWSLRLLATSETTRRLYAAARAHHRRYLLRQHLHYWTTNTVEQKCRENARNKADDFQARAVNKRLLVKTLHSWLQAVEMIQKARTHSRTITLVSTLRFWRDRAQTLSQHESLHRLAIAHDRHLSHRHWFAIWRSELATSQHQSNVVVQFRRVYQMRVPFDAWLSYCRHCNHVKVLVEEKQNLVKRELLHTCFMEWLVGTRVSLRNEALALSFHNKCDVNFRRSILHSWSRWVARKRDHQERVIQFRDMVKIRELDRILFEWNNWARTHAIQRVQVELCFTVATAQFRAMRLRAALERWKEQNQWQLAMHYSDRRLLTHSLFHWSKSARWNAEKHRMQLSADHFRQVTQKMYCMSVWLSRYRDLQHVQQMDRLALFRWSWRLQARCWTAWRVHVLKQRENVRRVEEARERYTHRVRRDALSCWMSSALEQRRRRQMEFCRQYWNSNFHSFRVALDATTHWYRWTVSRRRSQSPDTILVTVSGLPEPMRPDPTNKHLHLMSQPACHISQLAQIQQYKEHSIPVTNARSLPKCPDFLRPFLHENGLLDQNPHKTSPSTLNSDGLSDQFERYPAGLSSVPEPGIDLESVQRRIKSLIDGLILFNSTKKELRLCVLPSNVQEGCTEMNYKTSWSLSLGSIAQNTEIPVYFSDNERCISLCMDKVQSYRDSLTFTNRSESPLAQLQMTVKDQYFPTANTVPSIHEPPVADRWSTGLNSIDSLSTPGDLVSLAWLQKGDILQIAPLDGEEENQQSCRTNLSSLSSSIKSEDDYTAFRTEMTREEPTTYSSFSTLSGSTNRIPISTYSAINTASYHRPASVDHCPPPPLQCNVESPQLPATTSHLGPGGQGLSKPNYSYTHLIFMAIESMPQKCMTVNQIYNWCESNFPFYKHAGAGWKNSLRHNLSINKSFKRLPRDSRHEEFVFARYRNISLLYSKDQELEDADDEEGPGRGAYWTVEPRERPALMDAIKRNPWNFTSFAALMSNQPDMNGHTPVSLANALSNPALFGLRRFGLTQSAPSHLLRSEGMGKPGQNEFHLDPIMSTGPFFGPGYRLVSTTDNPFVRNCDSQQLSQISTMDSAITVSDLAEFNLLNQASPVESSSVSHDSDISSRTGLSVDWPAEEEEKYLRTLRSLMDAGDRIHSVLNGGDQIGDVRSNESKQDTSELAQLADEGKLVTKQRRKSRLLPTRVVDDSFTSASDLTTLGTCNECKENAASGCEACQAKRLRFLSDTLDDPSSFKERAWNDVANMLDSDQEHGPAGGPAVRKQPTVRCNGSTASKRASDDEPASNGRESPSKPASTEVYVTPAPGIDHEYAHCQAQLRCPEDNQLVNRFNEKFCTEMLRRLTRSRAYVKRTRRSKLRGRNTEEQYTTPVNQEASEDTGDDGSENSFGGNRFPGTDLSDLNGISKSPYRRGKYRRRRGAARTFIDYTTDVSTVRLNGDLNRRGFGRGSARGKRQAGHSELGLSSRYGQRRSKRVTRAPRRPYDDFEGSFSIDEQPEFENTELLDDHMPNDEMDTFEDTEFDRSPSEVTKMLDPHARTVSRGRRRGVAKRNGTARPHSMSDSDHSPHSSIPDEEARYLRLAYQRQQAELDEDTSSSESVDPQACDLDMDVPPSQRNGKRNPGLFKLNDYSTGALWSQSRLSMAQKMSNQVWPDAASDMSEFDEEDYMVEPMAMVECDQEAVEEVVEETDGNKSNERTTVEAAHLLLGISQMQSFRRQSGYISLDSSGNSETLAGETNSSGCQENGVTIDALVPTDLPLSTVAMVRSSLPATHPTAV